MIKAIMITVMLAYIVSTLYVSSLLAGQIPNAIAARLDQLGIRILDGRHTLRDFTFRRFARPDYLGELRKINAVRKDEILTRCLDRRRNLLVYLAFSFLAPLSAIFFYFRSLVR